MIYNMAMLMSNSMPMKLSGSSALVTLLQRQNIRTLFCSTPRFEKKKEPSKKYSSTLLLPKTSFPMKVEGKKRIARDKDISEKCKFGSQYSWQRENRTGSEYILHDGPPYANGSPHLGHAVNKILKDITGRFHSARGQRLHWVPGWDCHGLPIELKAIKGGKRLEASKTREIAGKFAADTVEAQSKEFQSWGLMADWENRYRTMDPEYVKRQLQAFLTLYEAGHVFRDYLPVYWSPSSRTALAEAELEYNPSHESTSVYVSLPLTSMSPTVSALSKEHGVNNVSCLVWTTTPWSLVANKAVCYHPSLSYSLLRSPSSPGLHLVASPLLSAPGVRAALPDSVEVASLTGKELEGCGYETPFGGEPAKLLPGPHVTSTVGTGLVHTAPAHGQDDYQVGIKHGLGLDCQVGEDGCYSSEVGHGFAGLSVLSKDTVQHVLKLLGEKVLHSEAYVHSYPYDWRTKQPVILRGSKQWFVRTDKLREKALEAVQTVKIQPENAVQGFKGTIERRPYWCISRQRAWGTFIPVIYTLGGDPVVSEELLARYQHLVDKHGASFWWTMDLAEILETTSYSPSEHTRQGLDILDIWFDSGISWFAVLGNERAPAHLYLEGLDQFSGWFYSSLLTSIALNGNAPYKRLFVHGFTLDEKGNKMSKSLGNVISPKDVVEKKSLGVDVLRWWVALHASSSTSVMVGDSILMASKADVDRIRNSVRFILGLLDGAEEVEGEVRTLLDRSILHRLHSFVNSCAGFYDAMEYSKVCLATNSFLANLSSQYMHLVKDRMYCDAVTSPGRISGQATLLELGRGIAAVLAPLMPHLTEEMALCCPALHSPNKRGWHCDQSWLAQDEDKFVTLLEALKEEVVREVAKPAETNVVLEVGEEWKILIENLVEPEKEIAEVLGVLRVSLTITEGETNVKKMDKGLGFNCLRCRRLLAEEGEELCSRCSAVVAQKN